MKVTNFNLYTFDKAFARIGYRGDDNPLTGLTAKVLVPAEDGGPLFTPLNEGEAFGANTIAGDLGFKATRRASFKRAVIILGDRLRVFNAESDALDASNGALHLYIPDTEPTVETGTTIPTDLVEAVFGRGEFASEEVDKLDESSHSLAMALSLMGMREVLESDRSKPKQPAKHEMHFTEDDDTAVVALTQFVDGDSAMVLPDAVDGQVTIKVFGKLNIMHEPGTAPEVTELTDKESDEFAKATKGNFRPTKAYTFHNAGWMLASGEGEGELAIGSLHVLAKDDVKVEDGFTWMPKEPFDIAGYTNYVEVKRGMPNPEDIERIKVGRSTDGRIYADGALHSVN